MSGSLYSKLDEMIVFIIFRQGILL